MYGVHKGDNGAARTMFQLGNGLSRHHPPGLQNASLMQNDSNSNLHIGILAWSESCSRLGSEVLPR